MKKAVLTVVSVLLVAAAVLSMAGCGNELLGTWSSITGDAGTTVTFKSSGAVVLTVGDFSLGGSYTAENGVIIMNLTDAQGDKYQMAMNYYIDENKLYLENENGDIETFSK